MDDADRRIDDRGPTGRFSRVWPRRPAGCLGDSEESSSPTGAALDRADSLVLVGQPVRSDLIEADVFVDGTAVGHVAFRDRDGFEEYTVRL
jgi:hypothetical protein